ncbi:hypothetical protein C8R42DRAFT_716828 [Lentinula raphanica]|nr:hypothetical protein C8R42DRAFT_716828 [Lentinula raphanica]
MMMSPLSNLIGLKNVIEAFGDEPYSFAEQAADDMDAEKEASYIPGPSAAEDEEMDVLDDPPDLGLKELDDEDQTGQSNSNSTMDATGLREVLNEASKGVSQDTAADYRRQALYFLVKQDLITKGQLFISPPHEDSAEMIVAVIMDACDSINLDGSTRDPSEIRNSYTHAQKIRAAFTYGFNCIAGLGMATWECSEITGLMRGNPSVSSLVSSYMVSLRRRKVQAEEAATSARAITLEYIGRMYDFNRRPENWNIQPFEPSKQNKDKIKYWGGPRFRRELHLAYTLAFTCLLRVNEVLKIQAHEIQLVPGNKKCLKITLPFQKTNQFGKVQPFYLYALPSSLKHLCPIRAYSDWINLTQITEGFIFRRMGSGDRISADPSAQLV